MKHLPVDCATVRLDEASGYMQENLDLAWETWEEID